MLESKCPEHTVAFTRGTIGPNGEPAVCPDFDRPSSTISVPACSGPGAFVRDTWGVTLSGLFFHYGEAMTAAELYKVWLEADVICIGRPTRRRRRQEKGKRAGKAARGARSSRGKGKQQGKAAPDPDYAIDSREGMGKGRGRPPARAGKGKPLGRQRRPWTPSRSRSRTSPRGIEIQIYDPPVADDSVLFFIIDVFRAFLYRTHEASLRWSRNRALKNI